MRYIDADVSFKSKFLFELKKPKVFADLRLTADS